MLRAFYTVPAFRFSLGDLASAVGKWSRVATFGSKRAKGDGLEFNRATLSQMVDNAKDRGDRISICADHLSVLGPPVGVSAPSLGFFYALALFEKGVLGPHWAWDGGQPPSGADDKGEPRDGLYARLGEITPRGMDPLVGLANYGSLSPTFPPPDQSTDEAGNAIGYALIDVAATSAPFQAGCELQLHSLRGVTTMAHTVKELSHGRGWVVISDSGVAVAGPYPSEAKARKAAQAADAGVPTTELSAPPSGNGATTMATQADVARLWGEFEKAQAARIEAGNQAASQPRNATYAQRYRDAMKVEDDAGKKYREANQDLDFSRMSATPSGAGVHGWVKMTGGGNLDGKSVKHDDGRRGKIIQNLPGSPWVVIQWSDGSKDTFQANDPEFYSNIEVFSATGAARRMGATAMASPGQYAECTECGAPVQVDTKGNYPPHYMEGTHVYCTNSDKNAASATSMGAKMNPDMMKKFGIADGATPADRLAKFKAACMDATPDEIKAMADDLDGEAGKHAEPDGDEAKAMKVAAAKMRRMGMPDEAPAAMAAEPDVDEAPMKEKEMARMSTFARTFGVTLSAGSSRKQALAAIEAASVPASDIPRLVDERVARALKTERETVAMATAAKDAETLATEAVTNGYPAEKRPALVTFARADIAGARAIVEPFIKAKGALRTFTANGNPNGVERKATDFTRGGSIKTFGAELDKEARVIMTRDKVDYSTAMDRAYAEKPHLYERN